MTRVESDETQDYASELRRCEDLGQGEAEELGFVQSAVSEPPWAQHTCEIHAVNRAARSSNLRLL